LQDTDICVFFAFSNIKKQANLRLPLHVQKLKCLSFREASPP